MALGLNNKPRTRVTLFRLKKLCYFSNCGPLFTNLFNDLPGFAPPRMPIWCTSLSVICTKHAVQNRACLRPAQGLFCKRFDSNLQYADVKIWINIFSF